MPSYHKLNPGVYIYAKNFETLHNCDLRLLGAIACKYTWIPAALKEPYREKKNFLFSDFVGFDVDNTEGEPYTLAQAIEDWADSACVIATTRSHQLPKNEHPPADRFRIITQWERRIETVEEYEYNTRRILKHNEPFDAACVDATRCFYPCTKIVFANFDGFKQPVFQYENSKTHIVKQLKKSLFLNKNETIQPNVHNFVEKGIVFGGSRNKSVYVTASNLLRCGIDLEKVIALIEKSPFDRAGFPNKELRRTIESAAKRYFGE